MVQMDNARFERNGADSTVVEVGDVRIGGGGYPVIAGPQMVESRDQMMQAAELVAEGGGSVLFGGVSRPSSSPYTFAGIGLEGLDYLQEAGRVHGLPVVTEVGEPDDIERIAGSVDMLQIGPADMQNFVLLVAAGRTQKPILLKRGPAATVEEWLLAAEYILNEGNDQIVLCEHGIRTFETRTRHTLDISAVPVVKARSHLPVIVDPTQAAGASGLIEPLALAARAAGADGLMVEVHPDPGGARVDVKHQLAPGQYMGLMHALGIARLRADIDLIDRDIVNLIARRTERAIEIAHIKVEEGIPLRSPDREEDLLADVKKEAERRGLDPELTAGWFESILDYTRARQRQATESD